MKKHVLVVIHGVGDASPGSSIMDVSRGLAAKGVSGCRADLVLDGVQYPRILLEGSPIAELVEVNWSDIARPKRNAFGLVHYFAKIIVAMLDVAIRNPEPPPSDTQDEPPPPPQSQRWLARAYRASFEALFFYCIVPPLVTMLWMSLQPMQTWTVVAIGLLGALVLAAMTLYLSKSFRGKFWFGWLWALALILGTVLVVTDRLSLEASVRFSTIAYLGSQVLTGTLLLAALLEIHMQAWSAQQRIARMGLLYLPFFAMSAIGALAWAIALWAVKAANSTAGAFDQWQDLYASTLDSYGYDLAWIELTFALLVGCIAIGVLIVALRYSLLAKRSRSGAGQWARDAVQYVLAAGAALFAALSIVYAVSAISSWRSGWNSSALVIYSWSALRFVPYLPVLLGPVAIAFDVIVDVLFYVDPRDEISTASRLQRRVQPAIEYAKTRGDAPVLVAGHSQGSVIALDVLGQDVKDDGNDGTFLITAGSPIHSLYESFLGSSPGGRAKNRRAQFRTPTRWINLVRNGDYVGGEQNKSNVIEENLGVGGHTGYWKNPNLWDRVLAAMPS
ncbi:MAG: hypothetical protein KDC95_00220 [Planctomycetes bacterium]|nr:hypothetical protein [Planctomycetota bacterium]